MTEITQLNFGSASYEDGRKLKGEVLRPKIPTLLQDEVREINSFLEEFTLEHGTHRGFFRGYNNGDAQGFAFNMGGRLYSVGDDSYQNLPGIARWKMTIDGEPVHEVDVRASYMNILRAFHGSNLVSRATVVEHAVQAQLACIGAGEGNRTLVFSLEGSSIGMMLWRYSVLKLTARRIRLITVGACRDRSSALRWSCTERPL
jgi:hypothetical protein